MRSARSWRRTARLSAILAALGPAMRDAFLSGQAFALDAKLQALRLAHPGGALVAELARILPARAHGGRERPCRAGGAGGLAGPLRQLGAVTAASVLRKPDSTPIAWCIDGARTA